MDWGIKFRLVKPSSPHLNGKVERAPKTDLDVFYSTVSLDAADLEEQLKLRQHFYNWNRPHGGLNGKSPMDDILNSFTRLHCAGKWSDSSGLSWYFSLLAATGQN